MKHEHRIQAQSSAEVGIITVVRGTELPLWLYDTYVMVERAPPQREAFSQKSFPSFNVFSVLNDFSSLFFPIFLLTHLLYLFSESPLFPYPPKFVDFSLALSLHFMCMNVLSASRIWSSFTLPKFCVFCEFMFNCPALSLR